MQSSCRKKIIPLETFFFLIKWEFYSIEEQEINIQGTKELRVDRTAEIQRTT